MNFDLIVRNATLLDGRDGLDIGIQGFDSFLPLGTP